MPRNEPQVNEKHWRRTRLFPEHRARLVPRLVAVALLLAVLLWLAWWQQLPPFDLPSMKVLP